MSNVLSSFDSQWSLNYEFSLSNNTANERGVFLGNGKLGFVTSFEPEIDVSVSMITTQMKYYNGLYKPNTVEPFYVNNVKFFNNNPKGTNIVPIQQTLNMLNAVHTSSFSITDNLSQRLLHVESDLYVPRHLPFCVMQSLRITPDQDLDELVFFHEVYAKENLINVEYNNNKIYDEEDFGVNVLSGKGLIRNEGDLIACACGYLIEHDVENMGFNVYRSNLNKCYNKFKLKSLIANATVKVHIISTIMTSFDFENPSEEVKRIVLSILKTKSNNENTATRIRTQHTNLWSELWTTDISVIPKAGISENELAEITTIKRGIRYSLYNIYSSIRENINIEVNPYNLSMIDIDGSILYDGDLWLIPLLILIKPTIAKTMIEYRYKFIDVARQLAAGYGYKGSKFPYMNETIGYKNALYWDTSGPMSVFNTALISINVWNVYRVLKDRDWLQSKGYTILKENADFLVSRIDRDNDNTYHLRDVIGLGGLKSADFNTFTNNMVRLALRSAIEASYELTYPPQCSWLEYYYNLSLSYFPNPLNQALPEVLKYDIESTETSMYDIMEPLFVLIPYYNKLYFLPEHNHTLNSIKKNLDFYKTKVNDQTVFHPYNTALFAILHGNYAQYFAEDNVNFKKYLFGYLNMNSRGVWGNMSYNSNIHANDILLNAVFLFMLLQGAGIVNVTGGVAETRFYYEEFKITAATKSNMPNTWKNIKFSNIGRGQTFIVTNSLYYMKN